MMHRSLSVRGPMLLGLVASLVLLLGFGLWATLTRLSGAVVAAGEIKVEHDRQIVQHPEGGVVAAILVREGAAVTAGQPLLVLDSADARSDLAIMDGQLTELSARTSRLIAERDGAEAPDFPPDLVVQARLRSDIAAQLDGQSRLHAARRATLADQRRLLEQRIDQILAQSNGIAEQQAASATQLDLIERELAAQEALLLKGLTTEGTVLALRREQARLQGQIGALSADHARTLAQVTETRIQISGLETRFGEEAMAELRQIEPMRMELAERRRALAARIDRMTVRAPTGGVVLGLAVTSPRAVLSAGAAILYLVPQDRALLVTARIAPVQIDEVHVGQPAELVFPAFSSVSTPHLKGRVAQVSADALTDPRTGASYFAAVVGLDPGEAARLGPGAIVPGMPVQVFLRTGETTPLAYLLKPFTDYLSHTFRES